MLYFKYKDGSGYVACDSVDDVSLLEEITQQEYDEYIASIQPTEEEIKAVKEAELMRLLKELYGDEKEG